MMQCQVALVPRRQWCIGQLAAFRGGTRHSDKTQDGTLRRAHHLPMVETPKHAPDGWLESLERSEAQLAAGEIVSGDNVMRELHASVARMEAKRAAK